MIRLPDLDDQTYEDIVETARRRVMQYFPQWTNFNPSDPGVTILELFAWLKEMQQYHLNRITKEGTLACLRLLGLFPLSAHPAETTAVLRHNQPNTLAEGFPFVTDDGLVFETCLPVMVGENAISAMWIDTGNGAVELSDDIYKGLAIEPFGPAEREGSCLYIGFDKPVMPELRLYFEIYDDYPTVRTPFGDDLTPSRDIVWTYGENGTKATVTDMTYGFSVSGEVTLNISGAWTAFKPSPEMPQAYWLCARLVRRGAEESPKITGLFIDFVKLQQRETLSEITDLTMESNVITLRTHLGIHGEYIVFAKEKNGWRLISGCQAAKHKNRCEIGVSEVAIYRVVSVKPGFDAVMSTETNLPGIRLPLPLKGFVVMPALMIENNGRWQDWEYVEQLYIAGPYDRVFTIEGDSVVFGDNEHGACPPAGMGNVLLSVCSVTQGAQGNVLSHTISSGVQSEHSGSYADNITPAGGGRDAEGVTQALARVSKLLTERNRCVTRDDYEMMAGQTPGTRILKTRAIDGYDPRTGGKNIPALVTVVVQPYGTAERPLPDARLLDRIRRYLEAGRLLGVCVKIAAPEYIPVSVRIDAVSGDKRSAEIAIRKRMLSFLSPTEGELGIGEPVTIGEVSAAVRKCVEVSRVLGVTLSVPSTMAAVDRSGSVELPPHAIVYAGDIDIHIQVEG